MNRRTARPCRTCGKLTENRINNYVLCCDDCHLQYQRALGRWVAPSDEIICRGCGKKFTGSRHEKFHNPACRVAYYSRKNSEKVSASIAYERVCPLCGETYMGNQSMARCKNEPCASRRLHRRYRLNGVKLRCNLCGETFDNHWIDRITCEKCRPETRNPVIDEPAKDTTPIDRSQYEIVSCPHHDLTLTFSGWELKLNLPVLDDGTILRKGKSLWCVYNGKMYLQVANA